MPEREAMNHLGHKSRAVHAAYAGGAQVAVMPLEFYEAQLEKKVVQFQQAAPQQAAERGHKQHHANQG